MSASQATPLLVLMSMRRFEHSFHLSSADVGPDARRLARAVVPPTSPSG